MYLINEAAKRVGLSQKRIREYEQEGFIKPERQPATNNRLYSDFDISQIRRISYLIHQRGFTVACLRNLMVMAPCWKIFQCPEPQECAAFQNPHCNCWEIRRSQDTMCLGPCGRCAVYLNRETKNRRILEHPGAPPMEGKAQ